MQIRLRICNTHWNWWHIKSIITKFDTMVLQVHQQQSAYNPPVYSYSDRLHWNCIISALSEYLLYLTCTKLFIVTGYPTIGLITIMFTWCVLSVPMRHVNTLNLTNNFVESLELPRITFRKLTNSLIMRLHIYFPADFGNSDGIVIVGGVNCVTKARMTKGIGHSMIIQWWMNFGLEYQVSKDFNWKQKYRCKHDWIYKLLW